MFMERNDDDDWKRVPQSSDLDDSQWSGYNATRGIQIRGRRGRFEGRSGFYDFPVPIPMDFPQLGCAYGVPTCFVLSRGPVQSQSAVTRG